MNKKITESIPVAIYARKSTDALLEREVHSLSVQRESAESFIQSQQHRGWKCLDEHFDDNNISGATLDRPALKRLKRLIIQGQIKVVVINRLDRISRSLSQFLELTEFFDQHGVSLVSVTQNFNTGDSMGRLMVQVIMSFAEFERSLIRDRVKERMQTAKRKGRFTGGHPILGYNIKPEGRALEVDEMEATRVREIFKIYLNLESVKDTANELKKRDWKNKLWVTRAGKAIGGSPFSTTGLHNLLRNPLYIGKVKAEDELIDGQHEPIVDIKLFNKVQRKLSSNCMHQGNRKRNTSSSLLKGLLVCKCCNAPFTPNYTKKRNRTYRYYTCHRKRTEGANTCPSPNLPAGEIENLVTKQLFTIGSNKDLQESVYSQLKSLVSEKSAYHSQEQKVARQQLDRINRELKTSRGLEAPLSLIRHLELKQNEAESVLEEKHRKPIKLPKKAQVANTLREIQSLWPSFTPEERCLFVRSLLQRVDYDAECGKITLHFSENGFLPQTEEAST